MITGKTKSGFEFEIEEEKLDDYELLELLMEADNEIMQHYLKPLILFFLKSRSQR